MADHSLAVVLEIVGQVVLAVVVMEQLTQAQQEVTEPLILAVVAVVLLIKLAAGRHKLLDTVEDPVLLY